MKETSHYQPGADTNHFLGRCRECDAHYLAVTPLDKVERWYHAGHIDQVGFEAYMHAWATGAPRYSSQHIGWTEAPTDPEVAAMANAIRAAGNPKPAGHCWQCRTPMFVRYVGLREVAFVDGDGEIECGMGMPHQLVGAAWAGPMPPKHCQWPMQYRGTHWQCRRCPDRKPVD